MQFYHKAAASPKKQEEGKEMLISSEPLSYDEISQKDIVALVGLLQTCAKQKDLCRGSKIHAHIRKKGLLGRNVYVGTVLINMYAKCGALGKAQEVFNELLVRNVVSWSALIAGYAQHGHGQEALHCFKMMQNEGLSPNAVTFTCILKACGSIGAAHKGEEIHAEIVRQGLLESNTSLGNALMDMYAKCGRLCRAQEVFHELPVRDVVSWNVLIAGYTQHGHGYEALNCYEQMQHEGLSPDAFTYTCTLKACGSIGAADKGDEIHAEVVRQGLVEKDVFLGSALVDMFVKCGALAKAQDVFDELSNRNVVSWSALISGYAQNEQGCEALNCFEQMQHEGLSPDAVTFTCILKACGSIGAAEKGEEIHAEVVRQGLLETNSFVGNALVDMYGKCGALAKAQEVFDQLPVRDAICWNALLAGYAQVGKVETVFNSFNKMITVGIDPNPVTFIVLLTACSHSGLMEEGQMYFNTMRTSYGIIPTIEHHACMVDLFGRAEVFEKAIGVFKKMLCPGFSEYLPLWSVLLGACRKWGNLKLGRLAYEQLIKLGERDAAMHVCMSDIYAATSM